MTGVLLVKDALVIRADGRARCSILAADGRIVALLRPSDAPAADVVLDAGGRPVIPGAIDPHVHLEAGEQSFEQDAATESRAAVTGGVTTFFHFLLEQESYLELYPRFRDGVERHSLIDVAFHAAIMNEQHLEEIPRYVEDLQVASLKFFMAYRGRTAFSKLTGVDDGQLLDGFRAAARYPHLVCLVHCEDIDIANREVARLQAAGRVDAAAWTASRPPIGELEALQRAALLAEEAGTTMYMVHMSVGRAAALMADLQRRYPKLHAETCNHYLSLDNTRVIHPETEANAALLKVNPPLRSRQDVDLLWAGLAGGAISTVGSDHCTRTEAFKGHDLWAAPPGLNGTGMILPVLLTEGVARGRISLEQLVRVSSHNPARIFGLYPRKGTLEVGSDADLVVLDLERRVTVTPELLNSVCDYSPYAGYQAQGWPLTTIVAGRVVQHEGRIVDDSGRGRVLKHGAYLTTPSVA
jgi:dihydroorotase (multifunctional complex type)